MKLSELFLKEELTWGPGMDLKERGITSFKELNIPQSIGGSFQCQLNKLTSLEYGPIEVMGDFNCGANRLTSLRYGPTKVGGAYFCQGSQLTSLRYGPTTVNGNFYCGDNQLTSLRYGPTTVKGDYYCQRNQLTSLEYVASEIDGVLMCETNQLTSLEHCPNKLGRGLWCIDNKLTSLKGIHKLFKGGYVKGHMGFDNNPITSHILGLLLISGLKEVYYSRGNAECIAAVRIINKHLEGERDVIDCQQELIEAGLKEFAQL